MNNLDKNDTINLGYVDKSASERIQKLESENESIKSRAREIIQYFLDFCDYADKTCGCSIGEDIAIVIAIVSSQHLVSATTPDILGIVRVLEELCMFDDGLKEEFVNKLKKLIEEYKDVIDVVDDTEYNSYHYTEIKVWK